ncbi:hypothetical protein FQR65_LT06448 [Abscondita terminalis]|nr:hypothetical protein FQR65_LT06448 [Abscondita terminalis]
MVTFEQYSYKFTPSFIQDELLCTIYYFQLATVIGNVDYRLARDTSPSKVCEKITTSGYACKNCTALVYCKNGTNGLVEIPVGLCPSGKICSGGRCITGTRCPFPNVEYGCNTAGIFPDPSTCLKYHICIKNGETYDHFEVECEGNKDGPKYGFNPEKVACSDVLPASGQCQVNYVPFLVGIATINATIDYRLAREDRLNACENPSTTDEYACKDCSSLVFCRNTTNNGVIEVPAGSCPKNTICVGGRCVTASNCPFPDVSFVCSTAGIFPDPGTCTKYHICIQDGSKFISYEVFCESNEDDKNLKYGFNPEKVACSDVIPVGVIPRTSIYYECRYYVNNEGNINTNILYPYQRRCSNGKVYNVAAVGLATVKGIVDYRLARTETSVGYKVCQKPLLNGYTCKNCTLVVHCKNSTSNETVIGNCPTDKICLNGDCVPGTKCSVSDITVPFACSSTGMFPDPSDCTKYHICVKLPNVTKHCEMLCEGNENGLKYGFNPEKVACSDVLPNNGQCQNNYVPLCKSLFETGAIPRTSIYYECRYYVSKDGDIDLTLLYPYQKRCNNGKVYSVAAGECK